ncbi:MAG: CBS domain-containing protein, partial [Bacteroidota bacterium]
MPFELTKQYLKALRKSVEASNEEHLHELLKELHPADIADVLDELDLHDAQVVYQLLEEERASEVLVHLEDDVRDKFLASLSSREIAEQLIDNLESDDAADVLSDLPDAQKVEVINLLEDKEQASDLVDLLNYQEGTAGALMGKEFISVNKSWTVLHCVKEMRRQAEQLDYVYTVYVTDDQEKLIGTLSIKKLLVTPSTTPIEQIYKPNVISVTTDEAEEDVANIMEKYDLV